MRRLLDVGNCAADHHAIGALAREWRDVHVDQASGLRDALEKLAAHSYDLVTVDRVMDRDGTSGLEFIRALKADERFRDIPVMMISNFAEHQRSAQDAGAIPGFGKAELQADTSRELLGKYLRGQSDVKP